MDARTYHTLTAQPLLTGVSASDLARLLDHARLDIDVLVPGQRWIAQGEVATHLTFLLDGEISIETQSPDGTYSLREQLHGPATLEPEILFGMQRTWGSTLTATTECHLMGIPKYEVGRMLASIEVFRLNYLNQLCTLAQRRRDAHWETTDGNGSLRQRFVRWVQRMSLVTDGEKQLRIKAVDLGRILGASRAVVCEMLDGMEAEGLLHHGRGYIDLSAQLN